MEDDDNMYMRTVSPQHDHLSDDDTDDDLELQQQHHQERGGGYSSSSPTTDGGVYRGPQELHHRTAASRSHAHSNTSRMTPPRPTTNGTSGGTGAGGSTPHRGGASTGAAAHGVPFRRKKWSSLFRGSVLLGLAGYFLVMLRSSWLLTSFDLKATRTNRGDGGSDIPSIRVRPTLSSIVRDQKRVDERRESNDQRQERAQERRQRTVPPPLLPNSSRVAGYSIMPITGDRAQQQGNQRNVQTSRPARLDELCGTHARNASLEHPQSYLVRDALNSKSRVLITGILNPLGLHLALALKERCGVQVIAGIDPMFPNVAQHRLALQKRIQLLTSNIPKLVQPIVLPLVGLDPRVNKKQKREPILLPMTGEVSLLDYLASSSSSSTTPSVTHIVHLASYAPDEYMDPLHRPEYWNQDSPYVTAERNSDMYRIKSSLVSMEQVLASVVSADDTKNNDDDDSNDEEDEAPPTVQRPHLTFASSSSSPMMQQQQQYDPVHVALKTADELLAGTYHALHDVFSVGVRLPNSIYGPWGRTGSAMYELAEAAVANWNRAGAMDSEEILQRAGLRNETDCIRDFVYVSDAVDAIIAAMQFRTESQSPTLFEVEAETRQTMSSAASSALQFMRPESDALVTTLSVAESPWVQRTRSLLKWEPATTMHSGMMKMLAWHLDNEASTGSFNETSDSLSNTLAGDVFLQQQGAETCAADDNICLSGRTMLPCVSECATGANCAPSIFDEVVELVRDVTEECEYVLYTQSLGYNVKDLKLQAKYDDQGKQTVCNFAFIPRDSSLVDSVIKRVPDAQLKKFGISTDTTTKKSVLREEKRDGLNGRLLYKGWILIWVKGATTPLPTSDKFLLKLNPGNFFSKDVSRALFVDENFPVSPSLDDVLFLMGEVHRKPVGYRSVYHKGEDGKKHKYKLQPEPERKAVMLLAPLKQRASTKSKEIALADGQRLTVYTATKYMRYEIGEDASLKETPTKKKQREFYERIPSFVNKNDMRSPNEPWYRYEMKHWIRTRWIVHDMKIEEGRELRCDWFEEHVQWGNDLDQLSFAHVMARRELERRIEHQEPDDHIKPPHVQHPELKLLTDAHEWHPYMGKEHRLDSLGQALIKVPEHMESKDEDEKEDGAVETEPTKKDGHGSSAALFVRIMSERVMMFARQQWAYKHGVKMKKRKKKRRKKH